MLVRVIVETPTELSSQQKELLEQLAKTERSSNFPMKERFEKRLHQFEGSSK